MLFRSKQPWRVILTRRGRIPKSAHVFTDAHRDRTLVFRGKSLRTVLRELGRLGVVSVLIEGGGTVLGDAFDRRLVDEVHFYLAPLLCGGPHVIAGRGAGSTASSVSLRDARYERIGTDLHVSGLAAYG